VRSRSDRKIVAAVAHLVHQRIDSSVPGQAHAASVIADVKSNYRHLVLFWECAARVKFWPRKLLELLLEATPEQGFTLH
jgi:hypothetical protein